MNDTVSAESALAELDALGGSDKIAARLLRDGYRGTTCGGYNCPVALYVRDVSGEELSLTSSTWRIGATFTPERLRDGDVPPNVSEFVRRFDNDEFPELIEDGTHG